MLVGFGLGDLIQAGAMLNGIRRRAERRRRAPSTAGEIVIQRHVEEVFDFVADERNVYDPAIVRVEKLTAGPVGPGTRFRSESRGMGGSVPMTVEVTAHERPRRLVSHTHSPVVDIDSTLGFEPVDGGTRLRWESELEPRGMLRMLAPVMPSLAERRQAEISDGSRSASKAATSPARPPSAVLRDRGRLFDVRFRGGVTPTPT